MLNFNYNKSITNLLKFSRGKDSNTKNRSLPDGSGENGIYI